MTQFRYNSNLFYESDHLATSFLIYKCNIYTIKSCLVIKIGKLLRDSLNLFFLSFSTTNSFFPLNIFGNMLSNI